MGVRAGTERSMQKITPNLWFNGNGAEGAQFYADIFPDGKVLNTTYYPTEGLLDFQRDLAGKPLMVDVDLGGLTVTCLNAGPEFPITPAISFILNFDPSQDDDAKGSLTRMWEAFSDGGQALMPLGEYPFSPHYGWVQDRYGVSWQLMLTDPQGERRPFVVPSLMFGQAAQNRAGEAMEYYRGLFADSRDGTVVRYAEQTGPAAPGSIMFADFTLAGQWFAAMDPGGEQDFTFNEGVSLQVLCDDQAEIDRLWQALSSVPEAEQCGWCKDRFGVSWQLVPASLGDLMERPGAYEKLMSMKKIEIDAF